MSTWPPRADDVYKCLYDILTQCTQCAYIPIGVVPGSTLPVGICESMTLPVEEQNLPLPVGICDSVEIPVEICTSTLVNRATTPSMYNVGMTEANVEYSQVMPVDTKKFLMHTEDGTEFRVAFETGRVAGLSPPFFTVPVNTSYDEDLIQPSELSLFFAGICSGLTMEIVAWA